MQLSRSTPTRSSAASKTNPTPRTRLSASDRAVAKSVQLDGSFTFAETLFIGDIGILVGLDVPPRSRYSHVSQRSVSSRSFGNKDPSGSAYAWFMSRVRVRVTVKYGYRLVP